MQRVLCNKILYELVESVKLGIKISAFCFVLFGPMNITKQKAFPTTHFPQMSFQFS